MLSNDKTLNNILQYCSTNVSLYLRLLNRNINNIIKKYPIKFDIYYNEDYDVKFLIYNNPDICWKFYLNLKPTLNDFYTYGLIKFHIHSIDLKNIYNEIDISILSDIHEIRIERCNKIINEEDLENIKVLIIKNSNFCFSELNLPQLNFLSIEDRCVDYTINIDSLFYNLSYLYVRYNDIIFNEKYHKKLKYFSYINNNVKIINNKCKNIKSICDCHGIVYK